MTSYGGSEEQGAPEAGDAFGEAAVQASAEQGHDGETQDGDLKPMDLKAVLKDVDDKGPSHSCI